MMRSMSPVSKLRMVALFALSAAAGGCSANDGGALETPENAGQGSMAISADGDGDGEIAGFQIVVTRADGTIASSQFVASRAAGSARPRGSALISVAPGVYTVESTPMKAPGTPEPDC